MDASATEIRSHIHPASRDKCHWKAWGLFLIAVAFYASTLYGAIYSAQFAVFSGYMLKGWMLLLNGAAISMLFIIGHDACHRCYSPSQAVDGFIGRVCFLPSLWTFCTWRVIHNYFHHGFTNIKDKDTSWPPMSLEEYRDASWFEQALERHTRTWLGIATHWFYGVWWRRAVVPRDCDWRFLNKRRGEYVVETLLIVAYLIAEIALVVTLASYQFSFLGSLAAVGAVFVYLVIPFWFYCFFTGLVTLLQHTHPTTVWFASQKESTFFAAQIDGTVHIKFPPIIGLFFLDVMEHNAHHVDPLIPIYHLIGPQSSLEHEYNENIVVEKFNIRSVTKTLRTCQLYDFEAHCWLDFDGNPTTQPVPMVLSEAV